MVAILPFEERAVWEADTEWQPFGGPSFLPIVAVLFIPSARWCRVSSTRVNISPGGGRHTEYVDRLSPIDLGQDLRE